jgi:hypothetical protein
MRQRIKITITCGHAKYGTMFSVSSGRDLNVYVCRKVVYAIKPIKNEVDVKKFDNQ